MHLSSVMAATVGYVLLLAFGGTLVAALWTFLLGLGGAPGALLAHKPSASGRPEYRSATFFIVGLMLCVIGQYYVSLAFSAIVTALIANLVARRPDVTRWILWTVAFFVSVAPAFYAAKDAAYQENKTIQYLATVFALPITGIGFWLFVLYRPIIAPWKWIPFVT